MLKLPLFPSTSRVAQFEGPQKVVGLLEVGSDCDNLMNQILHTLNSILAKVIGDERIVRQWDTRAVDFAVSAFVDEMADGFEVGFAVGDVGLDDLEHFLCCLGEFDEDTIVDLKEAEELQHLSWFGSHLVDTIYQTQHNENGYPLIRMTKTSFG